MKPRHKRFLMISIGLVSLGIATMLILNALNSNIALYITPSEIFAGNAPKNQTFRIGGMVKEASLKRDELTVHFVITDMVKEIPVSYKGILPDLFKEGRGAVVQGKLNPSGDFFAEEVLAKHDENYMPPAAQGALDQAQKMKGKAGS